MRKGVEALIAAIADKEPGTAGAELEDLAALTGKVHTDVEFAEYWSWTDLDTLARLTLTPEPPCIPDLSREELVELVEIIQHCSVTGREWAMRYYTALLRRFKYIPRLPAPTTVPGAAFHLCCGCPACQPYWSMLLPASKAPKKRTLFYAKRQEYRTESPAICALITKRSRWHSQISILSNLL